MKALLHEVVTFHAHKLLAYLEEIIPIHPSESPTFQLLNPLHSVFIAGIGEAFPSVLPQSIEQVVIPIHMLDDEGFPTDGCGGENLPFFDYHRCIGSQFITLF